MHSNGTGSLHVDSYLFVVFCFMGMSRKFLAEGGVGYHGWACVCVCVCVDM